LSTVNYSFVCLLIYLFIVYLITLSLSRSILLNYGIVSEEQIWNYIQETIVYSSDKVPWNLQGRTGKNYEISQSEWQIFGLSFELPVKTPES
jgi:hypothetical protein